MCGICGIYGCSDLSVIEKMTSSLKHRGPDSVSFKLVDGNCALGGTRLHITGDKNCALPYYREDKGIHILLDGEIYNYCYWKDKLIEEGYYFNTGTNTEVVWALYHKYGISFVEKLKGMYAIAIYDGDRIILTRDRMGIKPLNYYRKGKMLAFSSEIKAIIRILETQPELNLSALQEVMTFGYIYSLDQTLFRNIQQVKPGELIIFDGVRMESSNYYTLPSSFSITERSANYLEHKLLLAQSLPLCMKNIIEHDNLEKGIFLSGGVDSTLMALLFKEINGRVKTFTLMDSEKSPDLPWSRKVAEALGSDHYEFKVGINEYLNELPDFIYHYENLVAGGVFDIQGGIAYHLLCKRASQYVKVALTGEGADELFGGYYWTYTHPLGFADRLRIRYQNTTRYHLNKQLDTFVNQLFPLPEDEHIYQKNIFDDLVKSGLSNYHLWSVDRSCGAFGFEIRPFYLYNDIVDTAIKIPIEYKVSFEGLTKIILKDYARTLFKGYGIEEVAYRDKFGMPAAIKNIDKDIKHFIDYSITDKYYKNHPYINYLLSKSDVFMFDIFYYIFFYNKAYLDPCFNLREAWEGGIFENMYC